MEKTTESTTSPRDRKKTPAVIVVRDDWCKGCGFCVQFCPKSVLRMEGVLPIVVDAPACTRCDICVAVCPDFAIKVT